MRIGLISSFKEEKGPEKASRERDMGSVQKPVICHLNATSKALIVVVGFVLIYRWFYIFTIINKFKYFYLRNRLKKKQNKQKPTRSRIVSGLCC